MPIFTQGDVPWNSLDDNIRLPTAGELEAGYPCGAADQQLFNFTTAYAWGQVHNAIVESGAAIDRTDLTQLTVAIQALIQNALNQVSFVPVGAEIMWSSPSIPTGWLEQDGSTFDPSVYPLLAAHLGGSTLPDMRGEFARGFDNGRGIDGGRSLGSSQTGSPIPIEDPGGRSLNSLLSPTDGFDNGAGGPWTFTTSVEPLAGINFTDVNGAYRGYTRPRNVAKIFLIKHD